MKLHLFHFHSSIDQSNQVSESESESAGCAVRRGAGVGTGVLVHYPYRLTDPGVQRACSQACSQAMEMKMKTLLFLVCIATVSSQDVHLSTEPEIRGTLSEKVSISCQISGKHSAERMTVRWLKGKQEVYTYQGASGTGKAGAAYLERANLVEKALSTGDVSLLLSNTTITDEGEYTCSVGSSALATTQLKLGSLGTRPILVMDKFGSVRSLSLSCKSEGWHPIPEVVWTAGDGQTLSGQPVKTSPGSTGLLNVLSSITLTVEDGSKVTCAIINPVLATKTQETLKISGDFPPDVSPWLIAFWIVFFIVLSVAGTVFYFFKKKLEAIKEKERQAKEAEREPLLGAHENKDKKETKEEYVKLKKELSEARVVNNSEWKRILSKKHVGISLTKGSEGPALAEGNHYWEVEVGEKKEWIVGVKKDGVTVTEKSSTSEGVWALSCSETTGYRALLPSPFPITPASPPRKLGCLLDYAEGQLTFYDADNRHRLYTFDTKFDAPLKSFYQ
ncbi:butyrophilin subfamily 1 member A1 isoform X1 [Amia ocellicauda]|uniref:butyrophilin subfamily 1 member A1 isoform X1 n=1 Tax=Amia ocellicauda TaxID=2972642 RepID=UPI0034643B1E